MENLRHEWKRGKKKHKKPTNANGTQQLDTKEYHQETISFVFPNYSKNEITNIAETTDGKKNISETQKKYIF